MTEESSRSKRVPEKERVLRPRGERRSVKELFALSQYCQYARAKKRSTNLAARKVAAARTFATKKLVSQCIPKSLLTNPDQQEPCSNSVEPLFIAEEPPFIAEEPSFTAEEPPFSAEEPPFIGRRASVHCRRAFAQCRGAVD
uniref:Uncharacterized protein n=1 Tax=Trichuris muris TaxID=70415 RepID=A0A5S6Q6B8_TRIMR